MKKFLNLVSVVSVSTLFLTGCPGKGGKSADVVVGPAASGVAIGQVTYFANESCSILDNYYTCDQIDIYTNTNMTTPHVNFTSVTEFCAQLNNYQANLSANSRPVAQQTRSRLHSERCASVAPATPIPAVPQTPGLKSFTCQLQAKKGNLVYQGEPVEFNLMPGGKFPIHAAAWGLKKWGIFTTSYLAQIASVKVVYNPGLSASANSMDTIEMSTQGVDRDTSVYIAGYAGAENRIEITPPDVSYGSDRTQIIATCSSSDALARPAVVNTGRYSCVGSETIDGRIRTIKYTNPISDISSLGISISDSAFIMGDAAGQGLVSLTQSQNNIDESTVQLKAALTTPIKISIQKIGYSLKVNCQPK
jgi:hypothetical protein